MSKKNPVGRPPKLTTDVLNKLEQAFSFGASDREACFHAGISTTAMYNYQNEHPEFVERKEGLKERPILLARQSVVNGIKNDPDLALRYLERKRKDEFGVRNELTGPEGTPLFENMELMSNIMKMTPEQRKERLAHLETKHVPKKS